MPNLLLSAIQPSQLYIHAGKLAKVQQVDISDLPPVPVVKLDGRLFYTDGHTRAMAAYLAGHARIQAVWDQDELWWEAYRVCVDWCLAAEIESIADLASRIVEDGDYQRLWLDRCARMHRALEGGGC
jgi:hypothetical protein